jgi:hypothetical protein
MFGSPGGLDLFLSLAGPLPAISFGQAHHYAQLNKSNVSLAGRAKWDSVDLRENGQIPCV